MRVCFKNNEKWNKSCQFFNFDASSFVKTYNHMTKEFLKQINKEINNIKKKKRKKSIELENLIKIRERLSKINQKEIFSLQKNINSIKRIIKIEIKIPIQFFFSGSITKGTYVHGLSDIDIVVVFNKEYLFATKPKTIQKKLIDKLRKYFTKSNIKKDKEAINIFTREKNIKIQIVPMAFSQGKIFFPIEKGIGWKEINPNRFNNLLKERDRLSERKLITSIRVAKIIVSSLPKEYQLTSHHLEVLAYLSCKNSNKKRILTILSNIFSYAKKRIMTPIRDTSKQSKFIDEYLGPARSSKRYKVAHKLQNILEKINEREINLNNKTNIW